jgi:hypothetical protein
MEAAVKFAAAEASTSKVTAVEATASKAGTAEATAAMATTASTTCHRHGRRGQANSCNSRRDHCLSQHLILHSRFSAQHKSADRDCSGALR